MSISHRRNTDFVIAEIFTSTIVCVPTSVMLTVMIIGRIGARGFYVLVINGCILLYPFYDSTCY